MKRFFTLNIIVVLLLLSSCGLFDEKNPCRHKMEKEKFINVMTELYLIEAYLSHLVVSDSLLLDSISYHYNSFFINHDINKEILEDAINCYLLEKEMINHIHDEVLNTITILEGHDSEKLD